MPVSAMTAATVYRVQKGQLCTFRQQEAQYSQQSNSVVLEHQTVSHPAHNVVGIKHVSCIDKHSGCCMSAFDIYLAKNAMLPFLLDSYLLTAWNLLVLADMLGMSQQMMQASGLLAC